MNTHASERGVVSNYTTAGEQALKHAIDQSCTDPNCKIHRPWVIEDLGEMATASAWYLAGVLRGISMFGSQIEDAEQATKDSLQNPKDVLG